VLFLGGLVLKFAYDAYEERYIRQKQTRLRAAKTAYLSVGEENRSLARNLGRTRKHLEYIRRGALIEYYKHRRDYLTAIGRELQDAKQKMYDHVKTIEGIVTQSSPRRSFIEREVWGEFQQAKSSVHECIARSKEIETLIWGQKSLCSRELDRLHDKNTQGSAGAKRDIKEFLDSTNAFLSRVYQRPRGGIIYLSFAGTQLCLEERCVKCKARMAPEMSYCFVCGTGRNDGIVLPAQTSFNSGIPCAECGVELDEAFSYCFNCGERHDPFGLVAAHDA